MSSDIDILEKCLPFRWILAACSQDSAGAPGLASRKLTKTGCEFKIYAWCVPRFEVIFLKLCLLK